MKFKKKLLFHPKKIFNESNSKMYQDKTKESFNKKLFTPTEIVMSEYAKKVMSNQDRGDIFLIQSVLSKLLIPYLAHFFICTDDSKTKTVTMNIKDPYNEIAFKLNRDFIRFLTNIGRNYNTPENISSTSDHLVENLCEIADELNANIPTVTATPQNSNIVLICNNSTEDLLHSTNKYRRINVPGFEDKPFKVGRLMDKYIVYIIPVIDDDKLLASTTDIYQYGFYQLYFDYSCFTNIVVRTYTEPVDYTCHKLINLK
ncbi:MAG: hypothetical protein QXI16_03245 [Sulfolobaceae archaeon]